MGLHLDNLLDFETTGDGYLIGQQRLCEVYVSGLPVLFVVGSPLRISYEQFIRALCAAMSNRVS